jgi:hypothetical protein
MSVIVLREKIFADPASIVPEGTGIFLRSGSLTREIDMGYAAGTKQEKG